MTAPAGASERDLQRAIAARAYDDNRVRIVDRNVGGFTCLAASRQGLFAVSPHEAKLVAYGLFFGVRRFGDRLYLFETCDPARGRSRMGRVVSLRIDGGRLCDETVIATGLDNQCHQLTLIGERLWVVDTANQGLVGVARDGTIDTPLQPFGDPRDGYHHINSIAAHRDHALILLHNGAHGRGRRSELAWLDRAWRVVRREPIPGYGCHDIVADDAGTLWHCGSMDGEIINGSGVRRKVSDQLTRGLAFTPDSVLVGTSQFALREDRTTIGGSVLFLDRDFQRRAEVEVAGAPTEIALL